MQFEDDIFERQLINSKLKAQSIEDWHLFKNDVVSGHYLWFIFRHTQMYNYVHIAIM